MNRIKYNTFDLLLEKAKGYPGYSIIIYNGGRKATLVNFGDKKEIDEYFDISNPMHIIPRRSAKSLLDMEIDSDEVSLIINGKLA